MVTLFILDFWKCRNEQANFNQRHDVELMKEDQRKVVEAEIRKQVISNQSSREQDFK